MVCVHCASSDDVGVAASAYEPEWAVDEVTEPVPESQVQPARVPVSKPPLLTRLVEAASAPPPRTAMPPTARPREVAQAAIAAVARRERLWAGAMVSPTAWGYWSGPQVGLDQCTCQGVRRSLCRRRPGQPQMLIFPARVSPS